MSHSLSHKTAYAYGIGQRWKRYANKTKKILIQCVLRYWVKFPGSSLSVSSTYIPNQENWIQRFFFQKKNVLTHNLIIPITGQWRCQESMLNLAVRYSCFQNQVYMRKNLGDLWKSAPETRDFITANVKIIPPPSWKKSVLIKYLA